MEEKIKEYDVLQSESIQYNETFDPDKETRKKPEPSKRIPNKNNSINKKLVKRNSSINHSNCKHSKRKNSKSKHSFASFYKSAAKFTGSTVKAGITISQNTIQLIGSIAKSIFKLITLGLILLIMVIFGIHFWQAYPALGTLESIPNDYNYALAAYFGVAVLLLLFELLAFWRASTTLKLLDNGHVYHYDNGRGLFSFIIIYVGAYFSLHYADLIPEISLYPALTGIRFALNIYGSMLQEIQGICILGVISCFIRWGCTKLVIMTRHHDRIR
ncbi:MAG: hypothetical protein PHP50_00710 [Lachnospiraceae bacterium]|nr:hypothetical protein [Lachnospiraceae bacterium]